MVGEATGDKLGRFVGRARGKASEKGDGLWTRARSARRRADSAQQPDPHESSRTGSNSATDADRADLGPELLIDVDLSDALARAEVAEAEVARLRSELAHKEEILAQAHIALRTARLALRDHLRITQQ